MKKEKPETKICKYCQTEIPYGAKVCPQCRKKQGGHKAIGIILIVVGVFCIIGAISGGGAKDVTKEATGDTAEESVEPTLKTEFAVGEVAEYDDVQVSVLDYEESTGTEWGKPEDGKVFVFANIEITNNSDEAITISSIASFSGYCDDYKLDYSSNAFMAIATEDMQQLDGTVEAGKKLNGHLGFEVPADWSTIEIYYTDNIWLGSDFKFVINK